MKPFDPNHLTLLLLTIAFIAITMFIAGKLSRRGQNVMFVLGALLCAGGIFFRYGMGLSIEGGFTWETLARQQLQVCNFNFILVMLMLVPKFELARQYSIFFSMFAASTTLISVPSDWAMRNWTDLTVMNSWINHTFAIALPLWMLAAGRLKPQKKYILPVSVSVLVYFVVVYGVSEWLMSAGKLTVKTSYSFVYDTSGIGVFELLYKLIPMPFFYLIPLLPVMVAFFWVMARLFRNYKVEPYGRRAAEAALVAEAALAVESEMEDD